MPLVELNSLIKNVALLFHLYCLPFYLSARWTERFRPRLTFFFLDYDTR